MYPFRDPNSTHSSIWKKNIHRNEFLKEGAILIYCKKRKNKKNKKQVEVLFEANFGWPKPMDRHHKIMARKDQHCEMQDSSWWATNLMQCLTKCQWAFLQKWKIQPSYSSGIAKDLEWLNNLEKEKLETSHFLIAIFNTKPQLSKWCGIGMRTDLLMHG